MERFCLACQEWDVQEHPEWHERHRWVVPIDTILWCEWCESYERSDFGCADEGAPIIPALSGEHMVIAVPGDPDWVFARQQRNRHQEQQTQP